MLSCYLRPPCIFMLRCGLTEDNFVFSLSEKNTLYKEIRESDSVIYLPNPEPRFTSLLNGDYKRMYMGALL